MISQELKEIHYRHKAIQNKNYIDSNGDVYIGQKDGRILLKLGTSIYTKEEVDKLVNNAVTNITFPTTIISSSSYSPYSIINVSTTPFTVTQTTGSYYFLVDCTAGSITMNFPSAFFTDALYAIKKVDSSSNTVILTPNGAETIDGGASTTIRFQNTEVGLFSDGSNLYLI